LKPDGTNFICSYDSHFEIYLRDKNNDYSTCIRISNDSNYKIAGNIPDGDYEINVISRGTQNPYADSFSESISLKAGIMVEKDLKLTTPQLKVYILNPDGTRFIPYSNSYTRLTILNYDILGLQAGDREIESDGSFRFGGIPDGNYLLMVFVDGENPYCEPEPLKVHITAGQLIEQDMYLTHPLAAGQILKPDGTNFTCSDNSRYAVYLIDKNGNRYYVSTNNYDGSYKLNPLVPDGDYQIRVSPIGTKDPYADSFSESISLKAGRTVKRDIKLTTPEVKGYVLNPDGTKFIPGIKFSCASV